MSYITVLVRWYSKQGRRGRQSPAEAVLFAKTVAKSLTEERGYQLWPYFLDPFIVDRSLLREVQFQFGGDLVLQK